ncbi:hypothetical protein [Jannaschia helgolandensis]|uniref:hypothetical protein n=1 Tax=Jannaschia helgolandensis TaxID=188906 RepID=UPI0030DD5493
MDRPFHFVVQVSEQAAWIGDGCFEFSAQDALIAGMSASSTPAKSGQNQMDAFP